jgi:hypothetical protein
MTPNQMANEILDKCLSVVITDDFIYNQTTLQLAIAAWIDERMRIHFISVFITLTRGGQHREYEV